jgi:hypothetical protein
MQLSIRTLILATAAVAFCLMFARRDTKKGSVIVSQQYEQFVYSLLAKQGISDYETYSSSGFTRFHFLDANERSSIDESIERVPERNPLRNNFASCSRWKVVC